MSSSAGHGTTFSVALPRLAAREAEPAARNRVETAVNGREALDRLNAPGAPIDVVLLDLFMPVTSGWQLIEQLEAEGRLAETRIIVVTSAAHVAPPGLPVFEKPLDVDDIMRVIERLH